MYLLIIKLDNLFNIETEVEFDPTWKNSVEDNRFTVIKYVSTTSSLFWKLTSEGKWTPVKQGEKSGL